MDILLFFIVAIISYLFGFPSAHVVGKLKGIEITKQGSKNPGATNIGRVLGKKASIMVFLIDAGKAYLIISLSGHVINYIGINNEDIVLNYKIIFSGIFFLLGNLFPPLFNFKGGKGVATLFGITLGIEPIIAIIGLAIFFIGITTLKTKKQKVALSSLIAIFITTFCFFFITNNIQIYLIFLFMFMVIVFRHKENIKEVFKNP